MCTCVKTTFLSSQTDLDRIILIWICILDRTHFIDYPIWSVWKLTRKRIIIWPCISNMHARTTDYNFQYYLSDDLEETETWSERRTNLRTICIRPATFKSPNSYVSSSLNLWPQSLLMICRSGIPNLLSSYALLVLFESADN